MRCCWVVVLGLLLMPAVLRAQSERIRIRTLTSYAEDTSRISRIITKAKNLRHKAVDSGIAIYNRALIESQEIGYVDGVARCLTGLGLFHMDKGEYDKSLSYYQSAKPFCEVSTFGKGILLVALYNNIAALYGNRGIYDTAINYYFRSLQEMERRKIEDTTLLLLIYSNLGGRLVVDQRLEQSRFYLEKGRAIAEQTGNKPMLAKLYVDIATLFAAEKKLDSSRHYAFKALDIFREVRDPASEIVANCIVGNTYIDTEPHKAISYFQRAFSDSIKGSKTQLAVAYRGLGSAYYALKNYRKAEHVYLQALEISKAARLNKSMIECYKALVSIYADQGDYKRALEYRNAYADLKDSTVNAERISAANQLEIKYRTSEKDKELALQELLLSKHQHEIRQKNILIAAVTAGALLLVALIGSMYRSRQHKERLRIISLEKERELTRLKATMAGEEKERERIARELHDGIMVQLATVQMNLSAVLARTGGHNEELDAILVQMEEATKELRMSAHNLMPDMLLREGLAEATHYFCTTLERSARFKIDFELVGTMPTIAPEYELMLYRIVQELLQNVSKHAQATRALVQISCQPDVLSIVVEDDGRGFDTAQPMGMGLKGIETRVQSLHGHMSLQSIRDQGTSVYLELETQYLQINNTQAYADISSHYG